MSKVKKIATLSLGQGINVLVNFLFLPYMARVLSYDDYGTYAQVLLISSFLSALLSFGLPQVIYVFLNQYNNDKLVYSSNLFSSFGLAVLGSLLLFFSSDFIAQWLINDRLSYYLKMYSVILISELPYQIINSYFIHKNKVKTAVSITVFSNLIKVLLVVYVIQVYHSLSMVLGAILVAQFLRIVAGLLITKDVVRLKMKGCKLALTQLKKGFPLGLTAILGTGILYIDGLMVSKIDGVQSFAIYRNGAIEVPFIATIYGAIAAIVLPEISKLYSKAKFKEIIDLKRKVIMNTMMLTYPVLIFLLFNSSHIIIVYLGQKYAASTAVFAIFNLTILMRINDYHDVLVAANRPKVILNSYLFVFILNIILNYLLIHQLGIIGAAVATVISLFIFAYILLSRSLKIINAKLKDVFNFGAMIKLLAASIGLSLVLYFVTLQINNELLKLSIFGFVYFPLIYFYLYRSNLLSSVVVNKFLDKIFKRS